MDGTGTIINKEIAHLLVFACRQTRQYDQAYFLYQRLRAADVEDLDTLTFNLILR